MERRTPPSMMGYGKDKEEKVGVVACGPRQLLVAVRNISIEKGFDLHEEVFHW